MARQKLNTYCNLKYEIPKYGTYEIKIQYNKIMIIMESSPF